LKEKHKFGRIGEVQDNQYKRDKLEEEKEHCISNFGNSIKAQV